ncbi:MAG: hypothetical protein HY690_13675 [Chloroflexi bacterium]|nr:hypothetical protein [Chloroflexota bacterium]
MARYATCIMHVTSRITQHSALSTQDSGLSTQHSGLWTELMRIVARPAPTRPFAARLLVALVGALVLIAGWPWLARAQEAPAWYGCQPGPAGPARPPDPAPPVEAATPPMEAFLFVDGEQAGRLLHGVGFNLEPTLWSCPDFHPVFQTYIADLLRPALVRVGITQRPWVPVGARRMEELSWAVYQRELDSPAMQPSWEFLAELNRQGIAPLVSLWGAPGAMTHNGMPTGRLRPEHFDHFVEYYEAAIDYLVRQRGIRIGAASVMNEPNCGDGARIAPAEYAYLARLLGARLEPYGVPLYGPETCDAETALNYLEALLAEPEALKYFALLGVHQNSLGPEVQHLVERVRGAGLALPVYVTEYTSFAYGNLDNGQPASDEWGYALDLAGLLAWHLASGADAALYWDGVDYLQEHHAAITQWGLLSGPTANPPLAPRQRFWAMLQMVHPLQPGSRVLHLDLDAPPSLVPLAVLAPANQGEALTVLLVNLGGPVEVDMLLRNLPTPLTSLRVFRSSAAETLVDLGFVEPEAGLLHLEVPARAIVTLTQQSGPLQEPAGPRQTAGGSGQ